MTSTMSTSSNAILPNIHLLCMDHRFADAFNTAVDTHFPQLPNYSRLTIHDCALKFLPPSVQIDAVVSPANSYGRLDGAFDDALARAYSPANDYYWLTRQAQRVLYAQWKGFAPPGTCTVVPLEQDPSNESTSSSRSEEGHGDAERQARPWGTRYLMLCPTMREPNDVRWDREVVYECVWSLLCAVERVNGSAEGRGGIESVLMTPLATGCGRVPAKRWAEQCVLAMKHWVEAVENPGVWGSMDWATIEKKCDETAATYPEETTIRRDQ